MLFDLNNHVLIALLLAVVLLRARLNSLVYHSSIGALPSISGAILASRWVALDIRNIEFIGSLALQPAA